MRRAVRWILLLLRDVGFHLKGTICLLRRKHLRPVLIGEIGKKGFRGVPVYQCRFCVSVYVPIARLRSDLAAAREALRDAERYIRYGDGQAQDLHGVVVRSREREPVDTRPSRGEALETIRRVLAMTPEER